MNKIIVVEIKKCLGCRTCEIECAVSHSQSNDLISAIKEKPLSLPRIKVEEMENFVVPLQCRHCEDAPCVKICPTQAIERQGEEGPVLLNKEKCIGCKWCILVCPFGVIRMDKEGKAIIKCDLCIERLKQGEDPACVSSCPTGALKFVSVEEVTRKKRKKYLVELKK